MGFLKKYFFATPWHLLRFFIPFTCLLPLAVYVLTVFPCVYPGASAFLTSAAANLCQPNDLGQPLFMFAIRRVAALHYATLPLRLNLFCAACGAVAVSLFYVIVARLVFIFACEDPGGAMAALPPRLSDTGDDSRTKESSSFALNPDGTISIPPSVLAHNRRVSQAAVLGGLGAAIALAFSAPFWLASTRLYPYTFDLMLFFLIVNLLISYDQSERLVSFFLSAFLLTVCSVESPLFLLLLPIGGAVLVRAMILNEQVTASRVMGLLLVGLSGTVVALGVLWLAAFHCTAIAIPAPRPILRVFTLTMLRQLVEWVPSFGWSFVFMQLLFPASLALFVFSCSFKRRTILLFLLQLVLVACLLPSLINLRFSPWGIARLTSKVPVFSYVIISLFAGLMIAVWHLMREMFKEKVEEDLDFYEYRDNPAVCRVGSLLCWPLLALTLAVPFRSFTDIAPREGTFADDVAKEILKEIGPRDWIVNCHILRHHLMVEALKEGRKLHFIGTNSNDDTAQLAAYINEDAAFAPYRYRLLNAADLSSAAFIREWLKHETNAYQRVVLFDTPDLWRQNGFAAIPTGFFLSGKPKDAPVDAMALLASHRAFLDAMRPHLYPDKPDNIRLFANYRIVFRNQIALMANEIGVLLAASNHADEAANLFAQSEALNSNNLSLLLNRYHLAANLGVHPESRAELEARLTTLPQRCDTFSLRLADLQAENGTLINPDILEFARKTFWTKSSAYRNLAFRSSPNLRIDALTALRDKKRDLYQAITRNINLYALEDADRQLNLLLDLDEKDHFALVNKALIAIERKDLPEAGLWMDLAKENGVKPTELQWHEAALLILKGDLAKARKMLNDVLPTDPSNIRLWGLLAEVLLRQGEYPELESRVYPALRSASNRKDHYLLYMVRGYIYKHNGVREYQSARAAFLRALALNKSLASVREEVLQIDDVLDVPAFNEQDAKAVLRQEPEHALANYLLGMARLHRGELDKAEDLFRRSLEKERNAAAYTGLGAVMLQKGDAAAAEKLTRKSLELDASRLLTRLTLTKALIAQDRPDEANQTLDPVLKQAPDNYDARLTLITLRMKQKKLEEAAALTSDLLENEDYLPAPVARQLHALAAQLSTELSK